MSTVENLLLNVSDGSDIKTSSKNGGGNFLLDTIQSFKENPDELADFLKNLNVTEEDLEKIVPKDSAKEIESLIQQLKDALKNIDQTAQTPQQTPLNTDTDDTSDILKELINSTNGEISNNEFENKIQSLITKTDDNTDKTPKTTYLPILPVENNTPQITTITDDSISTRNFTPAETEESQTMFSTLPNISSDDKLKENDVVNFLKKSIESQKTLENLKLTDKDIEQFKNITSLKDLVNFANEKGLNLSKIVISQKNTQNPETVTDKEKEQIQLPKTKISPDMLKQNTNKKTSGQTDQQAAQTGTRNQPQTQSKIQSQNRSQQNILSSLINKDTKKDTQKSAQKPQSPVLPVLDDTKEIQKEIKTDLNNDSQKDKDQNRPSNDKTQIQTGNANNAVENLKQNISKAKESIKHFANSLKEAVNNYKPPISKLSMELNPKELGKVEVTLVHRGDNLQIQINSNNTAINFFHSAQQELKQNLINMGFTDVNMSFNQQQQQQQGNKEYRQNQNFTNNSEESDELIIEIPYQYA